MRGLPGRNSKRLEALWQRETLCELSVLLVSRCRWCVNQFGVVVADNLLNLPRPSAPAARTPEASAREMRADLGTKGGFENCQEGGICRETYS
jgi:hypothetical protein